MCVTVGVVVTGAILTGDGSGKLGADDEDVESSDLFVSCLRRPTSIDRQQEHLSETPF